MLGPLSPGGKTPNDHIEQSKLRREAVMHKIIHNAMAFVVLFYVTCMCCLVSVSYPILQFVARSMIHDLTSSKDDHGSEMSNVKHFGLTICYVSLTIVLSINITDLGIVIDFIGSTAGILAAFILPGYILMVPNDNHRQHHC